MASMTVDRTSEERRAMSLQRFDWALLDPQGLGDLQSLYGIYGSYIPYGGMVRYGRVYGPNLMVHLVLKDRPALLHLHQEFRGLKSQSGVVRPKGEDP